MKKYGKTHRIPKTECDLVFVLFRLTFVQLCDVRNDKPLCLWLHVPNEVEVFNFSIRGVTKHLIRRVNLPEAINREGIPIAEITCSLYQQPIQEMSRKPS
jgi:hypothetical protein